MRDSGQTFDHLMPGEPDLMLLDDAELEVRLARAQHEVSRLNNERTRRGLRRVIEGFDDNSGGGPGR